MYPLTWMNWIVIADFPTPPPPTTTTLYVWVWPMPDGWLYRDILLLFWIVGRRIALFCLIDRVILRSTVYIIYMVTNRNSEWKAHIQFSATRSQLKTTCNKWKYRYMTDGLPSRRALDCCEVGPDGVFTDIHWRCCEWYDGILCDGLFKGMLTHLCNYYVPAESEISAFFCWISLVNVPLISSCFFNAPFIVRETLKEFYIHTIE